MSNKIKVNLENLNDDERETLMRLVEKSNEPKSKVWKPEKDEEYYFIDNVGTNYNSIWNYDSVDFRRYDIGNVFKTRKEAEFAAEKQKAIVELERYALEHNKGEIDWNYADECKYYICHSCGYNAIHVGSCDRTQDIGQIYFTSMQIAQDAINAVGENRIKKYLFGVEE